MPSSYTTNGGIEKIATGEQSGTWGDTTNLNFDIIDRITSGVGTIDLSSSGAAHTLETQDGTLSDGMYRVLVLSGATEACTITVDPSDAQKLYFVDNNSGFNCTFSQGSGSNVTIANGQTGVIYTDGGGASANVVAIAEDLSGLLLAANNLSDLADAATAITNLGITSTASELNLLDGVSAGTIVNSKGVIYGSSGEVNATTLQLSGTPITSTAAELNLLDGSVAGSIVNSKGVIYGSSGEVNATTLQIGGTSITATAAELNYNDITTLGTTEASKTVTADSNGVVTFDNGISEEYTAVTSSSNATTVNLRDGTNFSHTLTENTTFTFSNPASSGKVSSFTLKIVQDASASGYTVTWPTSVDWPSATAPTLTATASAVDYFVFITHDGGTTYYGFTAGQALG
jgi:hypothetical protein